MVSWLGAVQSQEYGMAKWALGLRLPNLNDAAIEKSFNDGLILRTHVLRPTWHFVTPEDIRWMLSLTAPRVQAFNAPYYKKNELDSKVLKRGINVLIKSLQREKFMDRFAIQAALQQAKINAEGLRFILLLMHAELEGIICSGPRKGKQFTYALLEERAPVAKSLNHKEALFKLAHRYFSSRSPATVQDFAWWSGLTVKDAKEGAAMLPSNFINEVIDGKTYVLNTSVNIISPLAKDVRELATFLMPDYDEYGISYKDRSALFALWGKKEVVKVPALDKRGSNTVFNRMLVVDGRIAGSWKSIIKSQKLEVETVLFTSLSKLQVQLLNKAVKRYKKFMLDK